MSMELLEDRGGERDHALERLIMLSDGVFASPTAAQAAARAGRRGGPFT